MNISSFYFVLLFVLCFSSCKQTIPESNTDEFIIRDGFEIEIIAEAPLIQAPVAMTEDEKGRWWVVEMTGYMRDIDGNGEDIADGRIVILEDTDGDQRMDNRIVFADQLLNPRAIALVYGGALYTSGTSLYWSEIINDKAKDTILVDSLYVVGGNIEHQPNGLYYN
ncbi:MAG: dehydrogenase, partial [Bacteroidota bacterium]